MKFYTNNYQQSVNLEHVSYISEIQDRTEELVGGKKINGYCVYITLNCGKTITFWLTQYKSTELLSSTVYSQALKERAHLILTANS